MSVDIYEKTNHVEKEKLFFHRGIKDFLIL